MNKLCCLPLTETPEVRVKVNCISSCCASDIKRDDDDEDENDGDNGNKDVMKPARSREKSKKSCCGKKRLFSKSHAKTERREKEKDE